MQSLSLSLFLALYLTLALSLTQTHTYACTLALHPVHTHASRFNAQCLRDHSWARSAFVHTALRVNEIIKRGVPFPVIFQQPPLSDSRIRPGL